MFTNSSYVALISFRQHYHFTNIVKDNILKKYLNNIVIVWLNNKLDDLNTYFYTQIMANLYIFVKRSNLYQEFLTSFSSILF